MIMNKQYVPNMDHNEIFGSTAESLNKLRDEANDNELEIVQSAGTVLTTHAILALTMELARTNDHLEEIRDNLLTP